MVFDLKANEYASKNNENYELTMEHLSSHVFPTKLYRSRSGT